MTEFLKKNYKEEMNLDESKELAIASINITNDDSKDIEHIKISQIKSDTKQFEVINKNEIEKLAQTSAQKYQTEKR